MITKFLAHITPACKDVTQLASQSLDRSLPWSTRVTLQLHYWICEACAQYRRQLIQVRRTLRQMGAAASRAQEDATRLSPSSAARVKDAFRSKHQ